LPGIDGVQALAPAFRFISPTARTKSMDNSFREALEKLVNQRIEAGADPKELFEELRREANIVFGHYNLEYELGLFAKSGER
jgi:hypothetical protein